MIRISRRNSIGRGLSALLALSWVTPLGVASVNLSLGLVQMFRVVTVRKTGWEPLAMASVAMDFIYQP